MRDIIQRQANELDGLRAAVNQHPLPPQDTPATLALIASLREKLQLQSEEILALKKRSDYEKRTLEEEVMTGKTQSFLTLTRRRR